VQTQTLLDLGVNPELRAQNLSRSSPTADRTARDLEHLINDSSQILHTMAEMFASTDTTGQ